MEKKITKTKTFFLILISFGTFKFQIQIKIHYQEILFFKDNRSNVISNKIITNLVVRLKKSFLFINNDILKVKLTNY